MKVNTLVCFDKFTEDQVNYFKERGVRLVAFEGLYEIGKKNTLNYNN